MSEEEIGRTYQYKTVTDNQRHVEDRQALDEALRDAPAFTFPAHDRPYHTHVCIGCQKLFGCTRTDCQQHCGLCPDSWTAGVK